MSTPILYSFRRCPYAMRARLAVQASGQVVELREVVLRDKPAAFLKVSESGTVPCLHSDVTIIDESFDIMLWALRANDPQGWLDMPEQGWDWIKRCDGPFKAALDRTKYATRYPESDIAEQRDLAMAVLSDMNEQMGAWLFDKPCLADFAILPFVRQFAFIDKAWFDAQPLPKVQDWLERFLSSGAFANIMQKYPQWHEGAAPVYFPEP